MSEACRDLGVYLWDENGQTDEAVAYAMRACKRADVDSCAIVAFAYLTGRGVAIDPARARELGEWSCEGGSDRGCLALGLALSRPDSTPEQHARAEEIFRPLCEGRAWPASCYGLARSISFGWISAKDSPDALIVESCTAGYDFACLVKRCLRLGRPLVDCEAELTTTPMFVRPGDGDGASVAGGRRGGP